jgi:hypothetical protein
MDHRCPRCDSLTLTTTCPSCGIAIDRHWVARTRLALSVALGATGLGTLVGWMQLASLERSQLIGIEALRDLRMGLVVFSCAVVLLIGFVLLAAQRPLLASCLAFGASSIGALSMLAAPRWLWTSFVTGAPLCVVPALVAEVLGCVWAYRSRK